MSEILRQGYLKAFTGAGPYRDTPLQLFQQTICLEKEPVSINKAYTIFRGRKSLTAAGRSFKAQLVAAVGQATLKWGAAMQLINEEGAWAVLVVTIFFPQLRNKSWKPGGKTTKGDLRSPYQRIDASNYLKLIEDAVAKGSGIDDANNLDILIQKREDHRRPRIEITYSIYT